MMQMRSLWMLSLLAAFFACSKNVHPRPAQQQIAQPQAPASNSPSLQAVALPDTTARPIAPGFDGASGWLNVSRGLSPEDLRGHIVVVDFWTTCCINCLQTLPVLRGIETHFRAEDVIVVGVESPKFTAESRSQRLEDFLAQYGIEHPIAIDGSMSIWDRWHVRSWPSLFVLDTHGRIAWAGQGEPQVPELFGVIDALLREGEVDHSLAHARVGAVEPRVAADHAIFYPGKVATLSDGGLAISDTGHHRIVIVGADGHARAVIGHNAAGFDDGPKERALFHRPEGLVEHAGILYVADTENHAVRAIDLQSFAVRTIAGTGHIGDRPLTADYADARTALRSPWDVIFVGDRFFVALAGSHQIAEIDLQNRRIRAFAGSGREARQDGARVSAAFAQPSALATDGAHLFTLDSETSSVRAIDLARETVSTVVGEDLFVFGDVDGDRAHARLQHPLGLTFSRGALYVADTYNNKLRRVEIGTGDTATIALAATLNEPGGIASRGNTLFIANTNAHNIIMMNAAGTVEAHAYESDPLLSTAAPARVVAQVAPMEVAHPTVVEMGPIAISAHNQARFSLTWGLPDGTGVNPDAPFTLAWKSSHGMAHPPAIVDGSGSIAPSGVEIPVAFAKGANDIVLDGVLDFVVCDVATHRACVPVIREVVIKLHRDEHAPDHASATLLLPDATHP